jgi:3-oxoacyl-[acyl-carrier-protein] synthase II
LEAQLNRMDTPSALPRTPNPPRRPIAVSGIGVFCPIGGSRAELLESIRLGRSAMGPITTFDTSDLKIRHAAEIRDYDPLAHFGPEEAAALNRTAQFAIIAARRSLADADLDVGALDPDRVGLVVGICAGGRGELSGFAPAGVPAPSSPPTGELLQCSHYAQTDALAVSLGLRGPRATLSTACASSASALAYAYDWLQAGKVDVVLAGGADAFSPTTYAGFYALGAMAPRPCSPFSEGIGVTFGEGAGFVVLERLDRAQARGAQVHGELLSHGTSGDAHHFTAPHPSGEGLRRAMAAAVAKSGLGLDAVDYINAHGTGTRDNDTAESLAIRELFRAQPAPPVSSTKSFFGHTLGPAGVLEFIVSLLAQSEDLIPPTLNFTVPRAGCDLDYVPNHARTGRVRYFLSNSAAFGGVNAVLMGGRAEPDRPRPARTRDDVVVTGLGIVSPVGCGVVAFRDALRQRRHGIAPLDRFPIDGCRARHAALVRDFRPRSLAPTLELRRADQINQYAAVAASLALRDARAAAEHDPRRADRHRHEPGPRARHDAGEVPGEPAPGGHREPQRQVFPGDGRLDDRGAGRAGVRPEGHQLDPGRGDRRRAARADPRLRAAAAGRRAGRDGRRRRR